MLSIPKRRPRVVPPSPSSPLARSFIKRKLSLRKRGHTIHHILGNASTAPNVRKRGQTIPSGPAPSRPRDPDRDSTFTALLPTEPSAVVTHVRVDSKPNPVNIKVLDSTYPHTAVHQDALKATDVSGPVSLDINKPLPLSPFHHHKRKAFSAPVPAQPTPFAHTDPELPVRLEQFRNQYKARKKVTFALPNPETPVSVTTSPSSTWDHIETPSTMSTTSFPDMEPSEPGNNSGGESPVEVCSPGCDPNETGIIWIGYIPEEIPPLRLSHHGGPSSSALLNAPVQQSPEILQPSVFEQVSSPQQQREQQQHLRPQAQPSSIAEVPCSTPSLHNTTTHSLDNNNNNNNNNNSNDSNIDQASEQKVTDGVPEKMQHDSAQTNTTQVKTTPIIPATRKAAPADIIKLFQEREAEAEREMEMEMEMPQEPATPKTPVTPEIQRAVMADIMGLLKSGGEREVETAAPAPAPAAALPLTSDGDYSEMRAYFDHLVQ